MRILYLGLPLGALWLAKHGFAPDVVLVGHPEAPGMRRLRRILPSSSLVLGRPRLDDPGVVSALRSSSPDLLLSFFWPRRIPGSVLAIPKLGAFGTHPSLLPRHRGPDPYFWTLLDGDEVTGVTLHRLDEDYDTGAIIDVRRLPVRATFDSWTLARALDRPALALLVEAARRARDGDPMLGERQDPRLATHAPQPDDTDLSIDWDDDVATILRLVRAASPTPGALADIEDETVEVVKASRFEGEVPRALEVAEAFVVDGAVVVRAADGGVRIDAARDEAGEPLDVVALVEEARRRAADEEDG